MYRPQDPPNRYNNRTLIGNWFEERVLERSMFDRTEFGKYSMDLKNTKLAQVTNETRHANAMMKASVSSLGQETSFKSGMKLMLFNLATQSYLAVNTEDKRKNRFAATGSKMDQAVRRNVFQIVKIQAGGDDIIRFGDQVRIVTGPSLFGGICFFLASTMLQFNQGLTVLPHQELFFSMTENHDSAWTIENTDFEKRFKATAEAVKPGDAFLIRHCATGKLVGVSEVSEKNEFGKEFEAFVENIENRNKSQNLLKEMIGEKGAEIVKKNFKDENRWQFRAARSSHDDFQDDCSDDYIKGLTMLEELVDRVLKQGAFTLVELKNEFLKVDAERKGCVHKEDFFWTLANCGVKMTQSEFDVMTGCLQVEGDQIFYKPIFERFGEFVTPKKLDMIEVAIKTVQKNFPVLRLENLIKLFNCVSAGKQEINRFVKCWGAKKVNDQVTADELRRYWEQVGACLRTEEEFCVFLRRFTS